MTNTTELLSVSEVASRLKVTPQYVRRIISDGKLLANRIGNQWVVEPINLKTYVDNYPVVIEPNDHERLSDGVPDIVALSFFSGAMGLDIGMKNVGISALLACEFNKFCRMTIAANEPEIALMGDINDYSAKDILRLAKVPEGRKVDIMFGGPPCQAFSTAGARRGLEDARGNVFLKYIELASEIKPTYLVIENVRGLLSAPYPYKTEKPIKGGALCVIMDKLKDAGYSISFELYNAANFGAPQIRERVVIIAKLGDKKVEYLCPTHSQNGSFGLSKWSTLGDALSVLGEIEHHYIEFPEKRLKFYRMLKEGQYWKDLPPDIQKEAMGRKLELGGGKTGFFRRLSFSKPSPTLVTNPTMPATDLCHPTENRPLSVEEYGCIQGFPLDWKICGPVLEQYKQIGNAVPVKLGEAIGKAILSDMKAEDSKQLLGFKYSRYKNTNDETWQIFMDDIINKAIQDENSNNTPPLLAQLQLSN